MRLNNLKRRKGGAEENHDKKQRKLFRGGSIAQARMPKKAEGERGLKERGNPSAEQCPADSYLRDEKRRKLIFL